MASVKIDVGGAVIPRGGRILEGRGVVCFGRRVTDITSSADQLNIDCAFAMPSSHPSPDSGSLCQVHNVVEFPDIFGIDRDVECVAANALAFLIVHDLGASR